MIIGHVTVDLSASQIRPMRLLIHSSGLSTSELDADTGNYEIKSLKEGQVELRVAQKKEAMGEMGLDKI